MIQYRKSWQNTARIARALINASICRAFLQSVFTAIITCVADSIARISQIATAAPTSEIGDFVGLLGLQRVRGRCGLCVCHMMTGKDVLRSQGSQELSTLVPIVMDNLLPGSALELPWSFSAVTYGDDPNRAHFLRQVQDFLHFLIIEGPHEAGPQSLVHYREQDKHRNESPVDDAEETDSSLPISTCRTPYVRDNHDNQWSLGDEHLTKGGPRQIMFHSLITHHDELLWLCVPSRRIAGS
jgi:hypothetical protein